MHCGYLAGGDSPCSQRQREPCGAGPQVATPALPLLAVPHTAAALPPPCLVSRAWEKGPGDSFGSFEVGLQPAPAGPSCSQMLPRGALPTQLRGVPKPHLHVRLRAQDCGQEPESRSGGKDHNLPGLAPMEPMCSTSLHQTPHQLAGGRGGTPSTRPTPVRQLTDHQ